jgi:tRNA nucleotidyltransferase/poly(A) polymerase
MISFDDLANPQRRALEVVRAVAAEKNCRPYLVGGPVRDLLLGRPAIDIDLTLEEGSSTLARAVARSINGRVRSFPQFLTYKVLAEDFPEIDIATARTERYREPGALPSVSAGTLNDDLLRRDFSINAIALDISNTEIHDPSGGERDVKQRVVRVLHDQSFIDDPTRIFRAIRLAARLDFKIEQHTAELMQAAIRDGALGTVSKERLWRELFLAFEEADAPGVVMALSRSGALDAVIGPRTIDAAELERAQKVAQADPTLDREVLFTSAALKGNASPVDLEGSGFSQKRTRNVVQIANELPRFTDTLAEATSDRQRFRLLKHASPEMLAVIAAAAPAETAHVARFHDYRNFRLSLRGIELEVPLGPHIAKALERTREAVFTGEIDEEQARSFAREMAIKYLNREQVTESK